MAGYEIHVASKSDSSDFAELTNAAFDTDPCVRYMKGTPSAEAIQAYQTRQYQRDFARACYESTHYYKAVEGKSGKILAFAKWQYPHTTSPELEAEKEKFEKQVHEEHPPGYNGKLYDHFFEAIKQKAKICSVGRHRERFYLFLSSDPYRVRLYTRDLEASANMFTALLLLCVSPAHQRRGLGSMLIQHGLDFADAVSARTYIEANPKGLELYKRFGWKEVDEIVINMDDYGGVGIASEKIMIREPRKK